MTHSKKSEVGLTVIVILIIVVLFLGWLFNISQRECRSNKDCNSEEYCGSDFSCHPYPKIQKTIIQYNFLLPSIIIGIAIIIVAIIFNWNKMVASKEKIKVIAEQSTEGIDTTAPQEVEEISEPYYKPNNNVKTP